MIDAGYGFRPLYRFDLDRYLILSTSLSVFLWQVLYRGSINFYLGYVIILVNSFLLFASGELVVTRAHATFLFSIAALSLIAASITHNPMHATAAQIAGISLFSIYHYNVFNRTAVSLTRIIEIYSGWATLAAAWGYPVWLIYKLQGDTLYRFHSWFAEPSHYIYATLPAVSYWILKLKQDRRLPLPAALVLFSYVLADSSTGYLGIAITILLMAGSRSVKGVIIAVALIAVAAYGTYSLSANFRQRIDDTLKTEIQSEATSSATEQLQADNPSFGANATTFALISNGYVAWKAFLASPFIGNGLGTHAVSYEKYAPDIVSPKFFMYGLNQDDANSLFLRLASETGLAGLCIVTYLLVYFGRVKGKLHVLIRNAIVPYFALRLVRFGAYFSLENFFFIMIYGFNYIQSRRKMACHDRVHHDE